jgi:hypothetical protein
VEEPWAEADGVLGGIGYSSIRSIRGALTDTSGEFMLLKMLLLCFAGNGKDALRVLDIGCFAAVLEATNDAQFLDTPPRPFGVLKIFVGLKLGFFAIIESFEDALLVIDITSCVLLLDKSEILLLQYLRLFEKSLEV